ncbi:MAG: OmpA family protein [Deltaproteobacteria bacterium]|nr:OmpA family protein [Deltaproteobacteria bacterium]
MISSDKRSIRSINVWPGYVDALSALLMVVIFVVLVFTIAQFLLSEVLFGKENELTKLHQRVNELVRLLGLEDQRSKSLRAEVIELSGLLNELSEERESLNFRLADMTSQSEMDRAKIKEQLLVIASLQQDIDALRAVREKLERQVGEFSVALGGKNMELGAARDRSKALETRLADEMERTLLSQKQVEQSEIRIQALSALVGEQKRALDEERHLSADARAEVALLSQQINNMKQQLDEIGRALKAAETVKTAQEVELKELGKRLNIVLARQVNKLEKYQSEFFGSLREILGESPFFRISGDRFVLQSELLFESGSATLGEEGKRHLVKIAEIIRELSKKIPPNINWILRIDGHTDRVPIHNENFASNWELSTARAVSVVRFLADQGIPQQRMTAAGFSKFHPIDPSDSPDAYKKNRRIEIKLTSR